MSDTPRTDAERPDLPPAGLVTASFAQSLERELNQARVELARAIVERDSWRQSFSEQAIEGDNLKAQLAECQAARARLSDPVVDARNSKEYSD